MNNMGHEQQMQDTQEAVPGKDLRTTIDLDLQAVAELSMEGKRGAVVALDPRNGDVLAMVSRPMFDQTSSLDELVAAIGMKSQVILLSP